MNTIQAYSLHAVDTGGESSQTMTVNRIQRFCIQDGPGLRTTVFTQRCSLGCWWCHNPDTIPAAHPNGEIVSVKALADVVLRDALFWQKGQGGLTVSGGECLLQADGVAELFRRVKTYDAAIHCTVDTGGNVPLGHVQKVIPVTDLFLWDFKAVTPERFHRGTGGRVEISLRNLNWVLTETTVPVILRIPLIHGFNACDDELIRMAKTIAALPVSRGRDLTLEILPGHRVGTDPDRLAADPLVNAVQIEQACSHFTTHTKLEVTVRW